MDKTPKGFFRESTIVFVFLGLFIFAGLTFSPKDASAVPVFARKYQTSCTTCHVGFPKLNAFGEAFKNNGYRLPDDEVFVKEPPVWLGSEAYKRVWPNATWPGSIPSNVPLSFRIVGEATFDGSRSTVNGQAKNDFEFPHEVEVNSLGTMGDNLAFNLGYAIQDESGRGSIERVFLMYNDALGGLFNLPQNLVNMRLGLIDPASMPFSIHNQNIFADDGASIYDFQISSTNQPKVRDSQSGIEFFGTVNKRFRYAAGVVNGVARDSITDAFTDNNNQKDGYIRTEYKFGGLPFNGAAESSGSSNGLQPSVTYFDQGNSLTVGSIGYWGSDLIDAASTTDSAYYRVMAFLRANHDRYNVDAVYLHQHDDAAAGQFNGTVDDSVNSNGFYVEATAFLKPWVALAARYDNLSIEHVTTLGAANPTDNTSRLSLSMPIYARPNLRIVPEASLGLAANRDADTSDNFKLRLDFAY